MSPESPDGRIIQNTIPLLCEKRISHRNCNTLKRPERFLLGKLQQENSFCAVIASSSRNVYFLETLKKRQSQGRWPQRPGPTIIVMKSNDIQSLAYPARRGAPECKTVVTVNAPNRQNAKLSSVFEARGRQNTTRS